jgi:hypothetical protein
VDANAVDGLRAHANNVYADACFDSCEQECLKSGSLARTCQIECTSECPPTQTPPPVCTTVDNPAHDTCVRNDTAVYVACLGALPIWPFGPPWVHRTVLKCAELVPGLPGHGLPLTAYSR